MDRKSQGWEIPVILIIALVSGGIAYSLLDSETSNPMTASFNTAPLYTLSDSDWQTKIDSRTQEDATTNCYGLQTSGTKHLMYCDRVANSDTELSFKTMFRSRVKNYQITEIKSIPRTYESCKITDHKEVECDKDSKNTTCWTDVKDCKTITTYDIVESKPTFESKDNDYSLTSKALFTASEKRTYKIEWEDLAPSIVSSVAQGNSDKGKLTFPSKSYYSNELEINPLTKYNASDNNWGGVASNSGLDASNNITAQLIGGSSGLTLNMPSTLNHSRDSWGRMEAIGGEGASGWFFSVTAGTEMVLDNNTIIEFDGGTGDSGSNCDGFTLYIKQGATQEIAYNNATSILELTTNGAGWDNRVDTGTYKLHNLTGGTGAGATIPVGAKFYGYFVPVTTERCVVSQSNQLMGSVEFFHGKTAGVYSRDPIIGITTLSSSPSTYTTSGNRTLDGFCPALPDKYDWSNATLTSWNSGTNVGNMTIKFSDDNSTWVSETPYADLQMVKKNYACVQLIPNVTTTGGATTPRISEITIDYKSTKAPTIDFVYPLNSTYYTQNISVNVSVYDADGFSALFFDNMTANVTIPFPQNSSTMAHEGSNHLVAYVNDTSGLSNRTEVYFFVNLPPTTPVPVSPANNTYYLTHPALVVNNSVDASDTKTYIFHISNQTDFNPVWESSGEVTEGTTTTTYTPVGLGNGNWSWRVLATDGLGNSSWTDTMNYVVDSIYPTLEAGNITDILSTTTPIKTSFNISAWDTNLRDCFYSVDGGLTNTTLNCNSATYTDITWTTGGAKNILTCANDSVGHSNCTSNNLYVHYYTITQSATPSNTAEGSQVRFNLTLGKTDLQSMYADSTGHLWLNNTPFSASKTTWADSMQLIALITIPSGWGNVSGIMQNWNWSYSIHNTTSTLINTTTSTGTLGVYGAGIGACGGAINNTILNFSLYDEETKAKADWNITLETTATLVNPFNSNSLYNVSVSTNESSQTICVSDNFLNFTSWNLSTITRYEYQNHVVEYYYIDNYNLSSYTTQNISLYDLLTTDSTSFIIAYDDSSYLPVRNAVIDVWRLYVGDGIYRSVEHARTNEDGETRGHLVTEDVKYIFKVRLNGEIIYTSPTYFAICQTTPCKINLRESIVPVPYEDFGKVDNLVYSLKTNKTGRNVLLTYSTDDGSATLMNLTIKASDQYGNSTICEQFATSSGGTLNCDIPNFMTNTTYQVDVRKDGVLIARDFFSLVPSSEDLFGKTGIILAFFLIITLPMMALTSGVAMLVMGLIGIAMAGALALLSGGSLFGVGSVFVWILASAVIMMIKISKGRFG